MTPVEQIDALIDAARRQIDGLLALRAAMAGNDQAPEDDPEPAEDLDDLIDTATAASRFDLPLDTLRWMAREKGMGEKRGGRWLIRVMALREHQTRVKREK